MDLYRRRERVWRVGSCPRAVCTNGRDLGIEAARMPKEQRAMMAKERTWCCELRSETVCVVTGACRALNMRLEIQTCGVSIKAAPKSTTRFMHTTDAVHRIQERRDGQRKSSGYPRTQRPLGLQLRVSSWEQLKLQRHLSCLFRHTPVSEQCRACRMLFALALVLRFTFRLHARYARCSSILSDRSPGCEAEDLTRLVRLLTSTQLNSRKLRSLHARAHS